MNEKNNSSLVTGAAVVMKKPEHGISRRNIDPDALRILFRLRGLGFTAYLTGGAVRDMMLGKIPKDFDIVTDARPGQIKKYFPRVFIIGRRFRLAHIHFRDNKIIEVATFRKNSSLGRKDSGEGGKDPENVYGSPSEDAFRRDITINALFFDASTSSVIDFVGGIEDLRRRRIRIIGDPGERFMEDPVRIWRVIRYAARAGFTIDADTAQEIMSHGHLLAQCSGARLFEEFNKDLIHPGSRPVIEGLRKYGMLRHIIGRAGEDYENDPALFARLGSLLALAEDEKANGGKLLLDEMCAILFWPWLESRLAAAQGDMHPVLKTAFADAGMAVNLPKGLRAQVSEILVMVGKMIRALRTGRMRWSMRGRPQYALASRLCFLFEKNRAPQGDESFEGLFQLTFPQNPFSGRPRRRRH